jgi:hypothetical protein
MVALARKVARISLATFDPFGEGVALVYLGVGHAMLGSLQAAHRLLERAHRIFQRQPGWHCRANEALALTLSAVVFEQESARGAADSRVSIGSARVTAMYEEALALLVKTGRRYAAAGETQRSAQIHKIGDELRSRIARQVPRLIIPAIACEVDQDGRVEAEPEIERAVDLCWNCGADRHSRSSCSGEAAAYPLDNVLLAENWDQNRVLLKTAIGADRLPFRLVTGTVVLPDDVGKPGNCSFSL